jgi:hypothetical protein
MCGDVKKRNIKKKNWIEFAKWKKKNHHQKKALSMTMYLDGWIYKLQLSIVTMIYIENYK